MFSFIFRLSALLSVAAVADAQPYVSFGVGYGNAQFSLGEPYNGVIDDRSILYGVTGGYSLDDRWAIEAGVNGYGGFKGRATPCAPGQICSPVIERTSGNDITVFELAVVPRINIGDFHVFGKGGIYRARIDANIAFADSEFRETGVLLGAGARWYFEDPWSISLEAERLDDKIYQLRLGIGWGLRSGA